MGEQVGFGRPGYPRRPGRLWRGADICDESATRREGGQPPGRRWHTLVSCTLTTEYRPVRPLGEVEASPVVTLSNNSLTVGNIFQFVMT